MSPQGKDPGMVFLSRHCRKSTHTSLPSHPTWGLTDPHPSPMSHTPSFALYHDLQDRTSRFLPGATQEDTQ